MMIEADGKKVRTAAPAIRTRQTFCKFRKFEIITLLSWEKT
jgi:hypothetical protein